MSAYIVEDATINKIISSLNNIADGRDRADWIIRPLTKIGYIGKLGETLGRDMFALNVRSIEERYGEGEASDFRPLNYQFRIVLPVSAVQLYKSLSCFQYQACEGDCDKDKLYMALEEVKAELAEYIVSRLPDYDKAAWG